MLPSITLSRMLGASVYDGSGALAGRVREVAMHLQAEPNLISDFIIKTRAGDRLLSGKQVYALLGTTMRANGSVAEWPPLVSSEGMLLLERDLLDQQIIDVSGRKVVRVMTWTCFRSHRTVACASRSGWWMLGCVARYGGC